MTSLHDELENKLQDPNATPMFLPLEFLKTITCDFSTESELGRGGYGVVYKVWPILFAPLSIVTNSINKGHVYML
jgi:hypothetical protein